MIAAYSALLTRNALEDPWNMWRLWAASFYSPIVRKRPREKRDAPADERANKLR